MHKKATAWATSIRVGGVQKNKAWKALNSTSSQTMKYPFSDMTLNKKECKYIMQPIVKFVLTKAGIISTLHTVVRYGPHYLGGIGIYYPFVIQGIVLIEFLIEHYWKSTPSSPLLQANL